MNSDKIKIENNNEWEKLNLESDAKDEIEWFRRYGKRNSTEEVLLDMAKYLVQIKNKYNRQEKFLMAIFGSAIIGSVFGGIFSLVSGEWTDLFWSAVVFIASITIVIKLYGEKNRK